MIDKLINIWLEIALGLFLFRLLSGFCVDPALTQLIVICGCPMLGNW
jgi:hypothetical protein